MRDKLLLCGLCIVIIALGIWDIMHPAFELPASQWHCEYGSPCVVYVRNDSSEKVSRYFAGDPICGR